MFTATDHTTGSDIKWLGAWGRERTTRTTRTMHENQKNQRTTENYIPTITLTKSYIMWSLIV